jgi:carbonic anhydrase/acetyltransferase-like protein (isoleucine patch superfamily)
VVIRGDVHHIRIGRRSNVQDGTIVHVMRDTHPTSIGDNVTIGHAAVLHGCTVEHQCLIGMRATILNGARIGEGSIVAAGSLVTEGMSVPARSLVMGSPARVIRPLDAEAATEIQELADRYVSYRLDYMGPYGGRCAASSRHTDFLPDDVRRREHVVRIVRDVYEHHGFEPLETPALENIETLLGKYGDEGNKLIFKILRRGEHEGTGEAELALRYDLTVPLAQVVAQYQVSCLASSSSTQIQPVGAGSAARGQHEFFSATSTIGSRRSSSKPTSSGRSAKC